MLTNPRWADPQRSKILGDWFGEEVIEITPMPGVRLYDKLVEDGTAIAACAPSADDVRAEAQRRIIALTGATDFNGCIVKQLNASMRAIEITDKRVSGALLTPAEEKEAAALQAFADRIKAIRAASNAMEPNPPSDFTSDERWPQ